MLPEELDELLAARGLERFRSVQVAEWLYQHDARSFGEMTNLPVNLRKQLEAEFRITDLEVLKVQVSARDRTKKFLFGLTDGAAVEAVLLPEGGRSTVCISTQVGCAFGCLFCASGAGGLSRNLSVGEIVDQVRRARSDQDAGRLTNIVMMGMGEPLANYDATTKAVRIFLHKRAFAMGKRRITISTAGYAPGILRLADDDLPVRLALSLHATDNETRTRLMPINKRYPIEKVLDACRRFADRQGSLTVEYMLIGGVNDTIRDAGKLAGFCRPLRAKVNLIEYNPTFSDEFRASPRDRVLQFQTALRKAGILAFIRRSRGQDIDAACGQLRASSGHI